MRAGSPFWAVQEETAVGYTQDRNPAIKMPTVPNVTAPTYKAVCGLLLGATPRCCNVHLTCFSEEARVARCSMWKQSHHSHSTWRFKIERAASPDRAIRLPLTFSYLTPSMGSRPSCNSSVQCVLSDSLSLSLLDVRLWWNGSSGFEMVAFEMHAPAGQEGLRVLPSFALCCRASCRCHSKMQMPVASRASLAPLFTILLRAELAFSRALSPLLRTSSASTGLLNGQFASRCSPPILFSAGPFSPACHSLRPIVTQCQYSLCSRRKLSSAWLVKSHSRRVCALSRPSHTLTKGGSISDADDDIDLVAVLAAMRKKHASKALFLNSRSPCRRVQRMVSQKALSEARGEASNMGAPAAIQMEHRKSYEEGSCWRASLAFLLHALVCCTIETISLVSEESLPRTRISPHRCLPQHKPASQLRQF